MWATVRATRDTMYLSAPVASKAGFGWDSDYSLLGTIFHSVRTKAPGRGAERSLKATIPLPTHASRHFLRPKGPSAHQAMCPQDGSIREWGDRRGLLLIG